MGGYTYTGPWNCESPPSPAAAEEAGAPLPAIRRQTGRGHAWETAETQKA